jgi:cysteinyl-tRNA synthetase
MFTLFSAFSSQVTVMNVTDVDDKIIGRAVQEQRSAQQIADDCLNSYLEDMKSLNILAPDALIRVTDKIDTIVRFIQRIESNGNAYVNPVTGDVCIKSEQLNDYQQSNNANLIAEEKASGKQSAEDFVLWKRSKPGEPFWTYHSVSTDQSIQGRPGWHVECSAIATEALGNRIDFHFGGQDLMFPHHLNESACCSAWDATDSQQPIHGWSSNWIHFGKFIIKNQKMSKSLGNGISIKQHLSQYPPELLRIVCLSHPYKRGNLSNFNNSLSFNVRLIK